MSSSCSVTSMRRRLEGKVAVITGGASGIGESTARLFVQHGAKVLIADIQDDLGNSLCRELDSQETISYIHCDVTCDSDVQNAVEMAVSKYGKLDIMFNNAGIGSRDEKIIDADNEKFKRVFDVNVFGAFLGAKHAARVMIPAKNGCILFSSSVASVICGDIGHAYVASKNALVGLAKSLCVELGQYGIRVNCISPFAMATPFLLNDTGLMEKKQVEELISSSGNLKGLVLKPEDVAETALFLASDESKYVSGINLVVDGGYSCTNSSLSKALKSILS